MRVLSRVLCALHGKSRSLSVRRFPSMRAQLWCTLLAIPLSVIAWATLAALLRHRLFELSRKNFLVWSLVPALLPVLQRMTVLRLLQFVTALKSLDIQFLRLVWKLRSPVTVSNLAICLPPLSTLLSYT